LTAGLDWAGLGWGFLAGVYDMILGGWLGGWMDGWIAGWLAGVFSFLFLFLPSAVVSVSGVCWPGFAGRVPRVVFDPCSVV